MSEWPKFKRGGYEFHADPEDEESPVIARLMRVTGILDWAIKGDGFGAMAYYGGNLFRDFLLEGEDDELRDGVTELWKESHWDPNRKLKRDAYRGTMAHRLFEQLCQGEAELVGPVVGRDDAWWVKGPDGLTLIVEEYEAGVAKAYDEVFKHFDPAEIMNETRVHWTEHPIAKCPDEVCQHGYAGTLDGMVGRTILDMKTNKGDARWSAYPQMALYARAALQMGLIVEPVTKQIVVIPRPDGDYDMFDDKFVDDGIVDPILELYKYRRAWGPR